MKLQHLRHLRLLLSPKKVGDNTHCDVLASRPLWFPAVPAVFPGLQSGVRVGCNTHDTFTAVHRDAWRAISFRILWNVRAKRLQKNVGRARIASGTQKAPCANLFLRLIATSGTVFPCPKVSWRRPWLAFEDGTGSLLATLH
eukprot:s23_g14.t1